MKYAAVAFPFLALALLIACPPPPSGPPPSGPGTGPTGPGYEPPPPSPRPDAGPATPALRADGETCDDASQCAGGVCEGEGCGAGEGVCASRDRMCTQDLRTYCGCDGNEFQASGSCPGQRFASRGACQAPAKRADGDACSTGDQCASGVCEGEGCGDENGVCAPAARACTKDLRPYCGCDGQTFRTSGSCPGRRFAHRGECT